MVGTIQTFRFLNPRPLAVVILTRAFSRILLCEVNHILTRPIWPNESDFGFLALALARGVDIFALAAGPVSGLKVARLVK